MLDTEVALGVKSRIKMDKSPPFVEILEEQFTGTFYSLPPQSLLIPTTWQDYPHFMDNIKQTAQPSIPRKGQRCVWLQGQVFLLPHIPLHLQRRIFSEH